LAARSGIPDSRAIETTIAPRRWALSLQGFDRANRLRWVLARRKTGYGAPGAAWTQMCPRCLASDSEPYFRIHWRFGFVTECARHGTSLLDACVNCGSNLDYLSLGFHRGQTAQHEPLSRCTRCGTDWRGMTAPPSPSQNFANWQLAMCDAVREGWMPLGSEFVVAPAYLDGVYRLQRMLRRRSWSTAPQALFELLKEPSVPRVESAD